MPDFSLYMDMPLPMQKWNEYRRRALGNYWQRNAWVNNPQASRLVISNYGNDMPFEWLESKIQLVIDNSQ